MGLTEISLKDNELEDIVVEKVTPVIKRIAQVFNVLRLKRKLLPIND